MSGDPSEKGLTVRNLTVERGGRPVLSSASLHLRPSELVVLTGPSGCGKSLFLRAIAQLDACESGEFELCGEDPLARGVPHWRSRVLYVSQSRINLKGTPLELFGVFTRLAVYEGRPLGEFPSAAAELGLTPEVLGQSWAELSGGQAQRAALALALALDPQVLLLDEPTSACDPASTHLVEKAVQRRVSEGLSALWVSHDPLQPQRLGARVLCFPLAAPPPPREAEAEVEAAFEV